MQGAQQLQHGATIGHGAIPNQLVNLQHQTAHQQSQSLMQIPTGIDGTLQGRFCMIFLHSKFKQSVIHEQDAHLNCVVGKKRN